MFKEYFEIPLYSLDKNFDLSIEYLFDFIMEVSNQQSDSIGITKAFMKSYNYTWMLYQFKMEISRLPIYRERVEFRTWVSKNDKLKSCREVNIYSGDGQLLIKSTLVFLVIDIEKMKAIKLPEIISKRFELEGNPNFKSFESFSNIYFSQKDEEIRVYKSDIDYNQHVHSAVYLRWLLDFLKEDGSQLKTIEINFKSQAFLDDKITITKEKIENSYYHKIQANGKLAAIGKTTWR